MDESTQTSFNEIKQQFMLMKNGIVSDAMKSAGLPHRIVWGLNMPQLRDIALRYDRSRELFDALWRDTATRESVVIAPMFLPYADMAADEAVSLIDEAVTLEAIDSLTFNALRHRDDVWDIIGRLDGSEALNRRYALMRLLARVMRHDLPRAKAVASREASLHDPSTFTAASNILSDIDFLTQS